MEEELKKLKKELLKTQKDLEEVKKANKDKDRYYNDIIKTKNAEIEKKDKVVKAMAIFIANLDVDEEICRHQTGQFCKEETSEIPVGICVRCIKQYFEKQVEIPEKN